MMPPKWSDVSRRYSFLFLDHRNVWGCQETALLHPSAPAKG